MENNKNIGTNEWVQWLVDDNFKQLIKHLLLKNKNENEIFNYSLKNNDKQQHGIGAEKDEIELFELFKEADKQCQITLINDLGYCYQHGIEIEKNETKAFELFKEAAELGQ